MTVATPQAGQKLTIAAIVRAKTLAQAMDEAMAAQVAASDEGMSVVAWGISEVVARLGSDPQKMLDDNLEWLLLVLDALAYVTDGAAPTDRLLRYAPGLTTA